jgi:hypothetical protein
MLVHPTRRQGVAGTVRVTLCPRDSRGAIVAALAGDLDVQKSFTKLQHTCEIQGFLNDNYLQQGVVLKVAVEGNIVHMRQGGSSNEIFPPDQSTARHRTTSGGWREQCRD